MLSKGFTELFLSGSNQRRSDPSALPQCLTSAERKLRQRPMISSHPDLPGPACSLPIVNKHVSCFCSITHSSCLVGQIEHGADYALGTVLQQ